MSMPAVIVQGLAKRFGRVKAVQDVSFTVAQNESVVLWGANGAGKTTILRCLLGVMPFQGSIQVMGWDVRRYGTRARAQAGYVPQEIRLPGERTVEQTALLYARLRRVPRQRVNELLARWRLEPVRRQPVRGLSGGMKQKLALVIALLSDPAVLLLDEPTSNLDVDARREFLQLLDQLKDAGKTLVCSLHRMGEVWKLADRVLMLERGRKVCEGSAHMASLQEQSVLCFTLGTSRVDEATALLASHGYSVQRNGVQIWVAVAQGNKLEPIRQLMSARIPIMDLSMSDDR